MFYRKPFFKKVNALRQRYKEAGEVLDSLLAAGARNVLRLRNAEIPIAVGTDSWNPGTAHGPSFQREKELLIAAGMTDSDVFEAATMGGARALGREHELGSIHAGKLVDLLIFEEDPSIDIRNARFIRMVMKGGVLHMREAFLKK